jgi:hypothetical protein
MVAPGVCQVHADHCWKRRTGEDRLATENRDVAWEALKDTGSNECRVRLFKNIHRVSDFNTGRQIVSKEVFTV